MSTRNGQETEEVALIINLRSRWGVGAANVASRELKRHGLRVGECHLIKTGRGVVKAAQSAIAKGIRTIVVGGGDGTISAAVDLLANQPDLALGVLPIGTGNEVARVLGIPLNLVAAVEVVAHGRVKEVDLAHANGDFFMHTAIVGYPAFINFNTPRELKRRFGKLAYVASFLASMRNIKPFRAEVVAGNRSWEVETVVVIVGNGRFHVPARVLLPRSRRPASGLIVYTPKDYRLSTLLRVATGLWITRQQQPSLIVSSIADSVKLVTDPPQVVDLDGEYGGTTPIEFHAARRALRVLVP